jgi:hypothetical protein
MRASLKYPFLLGLESIFLNVSEDENLYVPKEIKELMPNENIYQNIL